MATKLTEGQLTLEAVDPRQRILFKKWDGARDIITFYGEIYPSGYLSEEWGQYPALSKSGMPLTVRVRAADCGAGCRCAGEYEVLQMGFSQCATNLLNLTN